MRGLTIAQRVEEIVTRPGKRLLLSRPPRLFFAAFVLVLSGCASVTPGTGDADTEQEPGVAGGSAVDSPSITGSGRHSDTPLSARGADVSGVVVMQTQASPHLAAKPAATKPAATKPAATKPAATKPAATKPAATKPAATKPATAKPATAKPVIAKPATTKPVASRSATFVAPAPEAAIGDFMKPVAPLSVTTPRPTLGEGTPRSLVVSASQEKQPSRGEHGNSLMSDMEAKTSLRRKKPVRRLPVRLERIALGNIEIEMVKLSGGSFDMGSMNGDIDERPTREVTISPFSIGRFEVTQRQWEAVMGQNPSFFSGCADCPVDSVSWNDIQQFVVKLNQRTGKKFRLPSEAEWEFACRGGDNTLYCGDIDETLVAWYAKNSQGRSQPVGGLEPNAYGLYDMSGNAYEWVEDCWHGGYGGAPVDGKAWSSGDCRRRVLRGGAWYYSSAYAASTYRNANTPDSRFVIYGFRLAYDR